MDNHLQSWENSHYWKYWNETDKSIIYGHWIIEIEQDKPSRMYVDNVVFNTLGILKNETPERCYTIWLENIFSSHIAEMQRHISEIIEGKQGDITYPWKSPAGNTMYLRSIALRDMSYEKNGIRLLGTFQDVTNVLFSEQVSRNAYLKSDFLLQILADTFEAVHVIQFDKEFVMPVRVVMPLFFNEYNLDIVRYIELLHLFVPEEDCKIIEKCINEKKVFDVNGNHVIRTSWNFKSNNVQKDCWYNILISLDENVSKDDMIIAFRDISELENNKNTVNILKHTSEIDGLTNIFNRLAIERKISEYIIENPDEVGLFLLLDLDNFKTVNDVCGHIEGDNLLIETADKLTHFCRNTDIVGRLGGDEFIMFLPSVKETDIDLLVYRIIKKLRKEYNKSNIHFKVTVSIGISYYPKDGKSFSELYNCSDIALYEAKHKGKNCYSVYKSK